MDMEHGETSKTSLLVCKKLAYNNVAWSDINDKRSIVVLPRPLSYIMYEEYNSLLRRPS